MSKVLVTGANGFIGTNLCYFLKSMNYEIIRCDIGTPDCLHPDYILENFLNLGIEKVFHLGAVSSTTETDLVKITESNIFFSVKLLQLCIERDIPIVYASSASVYGHGPAGFVEDGEYQPLNYYAISKYCLDLYVERKIQDLANIKVFGLRYFNVYGPGESSKGDMASPVHKFFEQSNKGKIKIFEGSENFSRDFIHVNDVVKITEAVSNFEDSGIYNVGTGTARTFYDVAKIVSKFTGAEIHIIPFPEHLKGKYQRYTCSNNNKIEVSGCTRNRLTLEEGIKSTFYEQKNLH